jgi:hypothetical protein
MHMVKSVGVMSVAKIMGLIYGCLGLIFEPLFLMVGLVGSMAGQQKKLHLRELLVSSLPFSCLSSLLRRGWLCYGRDWSPAV